MSSEAAIEVQGLCKRFGDVVALDGLDLGCPQGPCSACSARTARVRPRSFGSWRRCCAPTAGRAAVLGHDVVHAPLAVRRRIGLAGQFAAVDEELTGRENVEMIGPALSTVPRRVAPPGESTCSNASARWRRPTGARGRTPAACAAGSTLPQGLIGRPPVVLLDEPTTDSILARARSLWHSSTSCAATAPRSCSRPSTSRRRPPGAADSGGRPGADRRSRNRGPAESVDRRDDPERPPHRSRRCSRRVDGAREPCGGRAAACGRRRRRDSHGRRRSDRACRGGPPSWIPAGCGSRRSSCASRRSTTCSWRSPGARPNAGGRPIAAQ